MVQKSEIQIFLAHAHEDKEAVFKLYKRLQQAGYKPWLDKKDLIPGQNWRTVIPQVIAKSQLFIACLSQRSIAKQGYVQREFRMALNQAANLPPDSIYLIPIRFDECEIPNLRQDEYGINLRDIHWLDYWETDGFANLERAINHQYGPFTQDPQDQQQNFTQDLGNGVNLEMIAIPGGSFIMGTADEEIARLCQEYDVDWFNNEKPQHQVIISPFFMGKYPITQAQYQQVMGNNPSHFKGDNRPVEHVSWDDAVEFCQKLSQQTGTAYRLPSEAEWEYACRSVVISEEISITEWNQKYNQPFHFGETISTDQANYRGTDLEYEGKVYPGNYGTGLKGIYREQTTSVGSFPLDRKSVV